MALENYTGKIADMVATNPTPTDPKSQGDDHLRGIKYTLQQSFPNFDGPLNATRVPFTPAGNIAATNVQAALQEVDTEKVSKSGDTMTGQLINTVGGTLAYKVSVPSNPSGSRNGGVGLYPGDDRLLIGTLTDDSASFTTLISIGQGIIAPSHSISDTRLVSPGQMSLLQYTGANTVPMANHYHSNKSHALWSYQDTVSANGNIGFAATFGDGGFSAWFMTCDRLGNMHINGALTQGASDARLKKNVKTIASPLETLKKINGVTFEWDEGGPQPMRGGDTGFIAQNIEEVFPQIITLAGFDKAENGESKSGDGYKTITSGNQITALLVEAVKELSAKLDAAVAEIAALKADK